MANGNHKVAVVVPAYNVERFLPQCLDSLLAQGCPVEVYCCDDGSTDATGRILDEYARRSSRVHAFHQPNCGMSATYNRLLGELPPEVAFVGIVDSDDYVHPEMFGLLLAALERTQADVAECGIVSVSDRDIQPAGTLRARPDESIRLIDDMSVYWLRKTAPSGWINKCNKLYRREAIGPVRFRRGLDYEDDFFFATEINARIRRKVILPDRFYAYRRNPNSLNGQVDFAKYVSSAALRLRLSCETFLKTGRIPARLVPAWRRDLAKDAYRMCIRKNLKKNADPVSRRELFGVAGDFFAAFERDAGFEPVGLNPIQRLIYRCCRHHCYAPARLLVALT